MPKRRKNNKGKYRRKKMKGGSNGKDITDAPIATADEIKREGGGPFPSSEVVKESTQKQTRVQKAAAKAKKYVLEWISIEQWLQFSKLFFIIGFIIYIASAFSGSKDGMLVAYYWVTIGVAVMLFMTTILVSMNKNVSGLFAVFKASLPLVIPALFLLFPLIILIYIFTVTAPILARDTELPPAYNKINTFIFGFIVVQIMFLNGFYQSEIKNLKTGHVDSNKWVYISGLILATILTSAASAELMLLLLHF